MDKEPGNFYKMRVTVKLQLESTEKIVAHVYYENNRFSRCNIMLTIHLP